MKKKKKKNQMSDTDGAQDIPLQNMASWHTEYLKLKEFEKMTQVRRSLCFSPPSLKARDKSPI